MPSLVRFTNPIEPARKDSKSRSLGKEIGSKLIESYKLKRLPRDRDAKQKIQKAIESKLQERSIHTRSLDTTQLREEGVSLDPMGEQSGKGQISYHTFLS